MTLSTRWTASVACVHSSEGRRPSSRTSRWPGHYDRRTPVGTWTCWLSASRPSSWCVADDRQNEHRRRRARRAKPLPASTHTHTHPFNGPFSRTTRVHWYQKGKTNLHYTEARDSEWQWHQLGHMQVCTSLQTDYHASTPPLCFYRPDAFPAAQPTVSKHWRQMLATCEQCWQKQSRLWQTEHVPIFSASQNFFTLPRFPEIFFLHLDL